MFQLGVDVTDVHLERAYFHVRSKCSRVAHFEFDHFIAQFGFGHVDVEEEHFIEIRLIRAFLDLRLFHLANDAYSTDGMKITSIQLTRLEDFDSNLQMNLSLRTTKRQRTT